jgi:hypothetical protein
VPDSVDREALARQVTDRLGARPPEALLDVWTGAAPVENDSFSVYGPDEIAALNDDYQVAAYRPDLLLIGSDGDLGMFVPRGETDPHALLIDTGAIGSDDGIDAGPLSALAADGFRTLPLDPAPIGTAPGDDPTSPVDVVVTGRPEAGFAGLYEIRRVLGSDIPVGDLTRPAAGYPVTVLHAVPYQRYRPRIDDLQARYGCLAVHPAG